jgi:phosphate transport system protein
VPIARAPLCIHDPRTCGHAGRGIGHLNMAEHARLHFQDELRGLEEQALGALDLVVNTLDRTLEALEHQDIELASIVVNDDDRIDGRFLEVHQGILSLLALQAPVAGDLRTVAALLHVIKHAERMGDQCVNIAKVLPISGHEPPSDEAMLEKIFKMGKLARSEVAQAKQAFVLRDVSLAQDLVRQDDEINALNREVFRRAVEMATTRSTSASRSPSWSRACSASSPTLHACEPAPARCGIATSAVKWL